MTIKTKIWRGIIYCLIFWMEGSYAQTADFVPPSFEAAELQINLMWINKELNSDATYIFPGAERDDQRDYLLALTQWARLNPEPSSCVYLWYDSTTTSKDAVSRTKELLELLVKGLKEKKRYSLCSIQFKDIRDLSFLKDNPKNNAFFSNPKIPIYARVDLLRLIILLEQKPERLESSSPIYRIYTDFTVVPMSRETIFDPHTRVLLNKFGIVIPYDEMFGYENYFYLINPSNNEMMKTLQKSLVDPVMEQIDYLIGKPYRPDVQGQRFNVGDPKSFGQIVYDMHKKMFLPCLHHELGDEKLSITDLGKPIKTFEPGEPLNYEDKDFSSGLLGLGSRQLMAPGEVALREKGEWYPTKEVKRTRPSSHNAFAAMKRQFDLRQ